MNLTLISHPVVLRVVASALLLLTIGFNYVGFIGANFVATEIKGPVAWVAVALMVAGVLVAMRCAWALLNAWRFPLRKLFIRSAWGMALAAPGIIAFTLATVLLQPVPGAR